MGRMGEGNDNQNIIYEKSIFNQRKKLGRTQETTSEAFSGIHRIMFTWSMLVHIHMHPYIYAQMHKVKSH